MNKTGIFNIWLDEGIPRGRILYEKKGIKYSVDVMDLLKNFDDKKISIKVIEIKE